MCWPWKSSPSKGITKGQRWHTEAFQPCGCLEISISCTFATRMHSVIYFHVHCALKGGYPAAQVHNTIHNTTFVQGIPGHSGLHLPSVQQQLLLPPQLFTQSRIMVSVFQPFLENLKQEVSLGIQAAWRWPSPTSQLEYHLLNKAGQRGKQCLSGLHISLHSNPLWFSKVIHRDQYLYFHAIAHIWELNASLLYADIIEKS